MAAPAISSVRAPDDPRRAGSTSAYPPDRAQAVDLDATGYGFQLRREASVIEDRIAMLEECRRAISGYLESVV